MALTDQQKADIDRLRDNERLTSNLTDRSAQAVLDWAEGQIAAGMTYETVVASLKAANRTGTEDPALALAAAHTWLAQAAPPVTAALTLSPAEPVDAGAAAGDMDVKLPLPTSDEGPDDAGAA